MHINQAIRKFTKGYRSPNTQRAYGCALGQFVDWAGVRTVHDLDPNIVMKWVEALVDKELSIRTIQLYVTAVTGLMSYVKEEELGDVSGDDYLKLKQRLKRWNQKHKVETLPRLPGEKTVQATLTKAHLEDSKDQRKHLYYLRQCALLETWAATGCRISESAKLKRADLNMHNMTALVRGGKGNRDRTIIWKEKRAWNTLMEYLAERDKLLEDGFIVVGEEPVFARHDYHAHARQQVEAMGANSMRVAHKELCKRALMKYYKPHSLRHRVITNILNETGNMKAAQEFAGHKNISTTADTYTHLATDKLIEIVRGGNNG